MSNAEIIELTGRKYRCVLNITKLVRWEQSKREDIKDSKVGNHIITLARLTENVREHHDKAESREYRIPRPPNKPGVYRIFAATPKRLAAGQSTIQAKEQA